MATILNLDQEHVFDLCAKYLARDDDSPRHNYLNVLPSTLGRFSEGWRFPVVEAHFDGRSDHGTLLWTLFNLTLWHRRWIEQRSV